MKSSKTSQIPSRFHHLQQTGTRYSHCDELCQLAFQKFSTTFSTKRFIFTQMHKQLWVFEEDIFTVPLLLYHVQCPSSVGLGLWLEPNIPGSPATPSMSSPLSTKDEEPEEVHPHHCTFISPDSMRWCSRGKPNLGAGESSFWVSLGEPGSGVICCWGSYTNTDGSDTCLPSERQGLVVGLV